MPAPIAHIIFAQSYLRRRPSLNHRELLRGTVFPDIRKVAELEREATHRRDVTMQEIDHEADAWHVGYLLHSYIDQAWTEFFLPYGLKIDDESFANTWLAVKIVEEILIFDQLSNLDAFSDIFDGSLGSNEARFGVTADHIRRWDGWILWKCTRQYESGTWIDKAAILHMPRADLIEIAALVQQFRHDEAWIKRLKLLHQTLGYANA